MIRFLRKYQRLFFVVITVVIIITFTFFGAQNSDNNSEYQRQDKNVGKAIDGSLIKQSEIDLLSFFLSTDQKSYFSTKERSSTPNLLNDGVVYKDFIETGIASSLIERYFKELKPDLQDRFENMKHYSFYSHPQAPFISTKAIWKQICPQMIDSLEALNRHEEMDVSVFQTMMDLYCHQQKLYPDMLRKILLYQQSQYPWVTPDQRLLNENLSLFGFISLQDWFGQSFLDLISQFIINVSIIAEKKGYVVVEEEVLADLMSNMKKGLESQNKDNQLFSRSKKDYFTEQLHLLGLDEKNVVKIWKKVLLFRRYIHDISNSIFVDNLTYDEYRSFADEKTQVNLYQLPSYLQLKDFHGLMQLEMYLLATSPRDSSLLFSSKSLSLKAN